MPAAPAARARRVFALVSLATVCVIGGIHASQSWERDRLHQGVVRDQARLAARRAASSATQTADAERPA